MHSQLLMLVECSLWKLRQQISSAAKPLDPELGAGKQKPLLPVYCSNDAHP
eukprot:CAMPEP_0202918778 /NCGR_PEP_ID=MMETSP1392-20130828/74244_1 /ASSEMBLY_ACC=CAM_ASM_000868 /TAXON_ID=225041 /ORGANISM="Chlamydomonas chlamydogama, Strain SAG 11-48b" /LENGTH=50 /DNA_ID=CAMNT_0049611929 /DNA_START=41 /DNA_END=189 /DNA_ORIENTATION=-